MYDTKMNEQNEQCENTIQMQNPFRFLSVYLSRFLFFTRMQIISLSFIGPKERPKEPVVVMGANAGHIPLLLNFACGLRQKGIPMPTHIVFVSSKTLENQLLSLGFKVCIVISNGCRWLQSPFWLLVIVVFH